MSWNPKSGNSTDRSGEDVDRFTISDQPIEGLARSSGSLLSDLCWRLQFGLRGVMQSAFTVGQLVRVRKMAGRLCEVVRILPVTEGGRHLYLIRSEQGAELIVTHHELRRA
jgi:hypothetical protein